MDFFGKQNAFSMKKNLIKMRELRPDLSGALFANFSGGKSIGEFAKKRVRRAEIGAQIKKPQNLLWFCEI